MATKRKQEKVTKAGIRRALALLGDTPGKIAAALRRRQVTGIRRSSIGCALAEYLNKHFGIGVGCNEHCRLIIDGNEIVFGKPYGPTSFYPACDSPAVRTPEVVAEFIDAFDSNAYPKLVKA